MEKRETAAQKLGYRPMRYEFGLYPTAEQAAALIDQAAMCRTLQNALNAIVEQRYLRKIGAEGARTPYLLYPGAVDETDNYKRPRSGEMSKWVTGLLRHDARWRALSTCTPRRIVDAVDRSWSAFFRNIKNNPEMAGKPRRKSADDFWIPYIHRKRAGELGSSGSGCNLTHVGGKNWALTLKGVAGPIHCRGQMPVSTVYGDLERDRFIDADVKYVGNKWKLSICSYIKRQRVPGFADTRVVFNLIDGFARVNGVAVYLPEVTAAQVLQGDIDRAKSERDSRWPQRALRDPDWRAANSAIVRLERRATRMRRNALHVWTTRLISQASAITVVKPPVREKTTTPRGTEKNWGAAVATVSKLNRHVLSQAPSLAIALIQYKAEEAGIQCNIVDDVASDLVVGEKLVAAGKQLRRTKRALRDVA